MQASILGWPPNLGFDVEDREPESPTSGFSRSTAGRTIDGFRGFEPPVGIRLSLPPDGPRLPQRH